MRKLFSIITLIAALIGAPVVAVVPFKHRKEDTGE